MLSASTLATEPDQASSRYTVQGFFKKDLARPWLRDAGPTTMQREQNQITAHIESSISLSPC